MTEIIKTYRQEVPAARFTGKRYGNGDRGADGGILTEESGAFWFFERCGCPRFTTPDEKGTIILDICHYVE